MEQFIDHRSPTPLGRIAVPPQPRLVPFELSKRTLRFNMKREAICGVVRWATTSLLASPTDSAGEPALEGVVITAVSRLVPIKSPRSFCTTLHVSRAPDFNYRAVRMIDLMAAATEAAPSVGAPQPGRLVQEIREHCLVRWTFTISSPACCLQYAAAWLPSTINLSFLLQESYGQRLLTTSTMPSSVCWLHIYRCVAALGSEPGLLLTGIA